MPLSPFTARKTPPQTGKTNPPAISHDRRYIIIRNLINLDFMRMGFSDPPRAQRSQMPRNFLQSGLGRPFYYKGHEHRHTATPNLT